MENLQLFGGIMGLAVDLYLMWIIYNDKTNKLEQSFATWILWCLLDTIIAINTILQPHSGNYALSVGYATGSALVSILLIFKKQVKWGNFETFIAFLVIACLFVWWHEGHRAAIITGAIALSLASVPQMLATFKEPWKTSTKIYIFFTIANTISFVGGKDWTVEERLFSGTAIIVCSLITLLSMKGEKLLKADVT